MSQYLQTVTGKLFACTDAPLVPGSKNTGRLLCFCASFSCDIFKPLGSLNIELNGLAGGRFVRLEVEDTLEEGANADAVLKDRAARAATLQMEKRRMADFVRDSFCVNVVRGI